MSQLENIQEYWNARAYDFSAASVKELETEPGKYWTSIFQNELGDKKLQVLDCGAGTGFFTILLSQMGHEVTAVDYSPEMIKENMEGLKERNLTATVLQMDAQKLSFPDNTFDAIVTRNLMWNLEQPEKAYQEFFRVLKEGGKLILQDGNHYLHLHNKKYEEAKKNIVKKSVDVSYHDQYNSKQIDYSIMEDIAMDLPLSKQIRPVWDFKCLLNNGFSQVKVEASYMNTGAEKLPSKFLIVAKKA